MAEVAWPFLIGRARNDDYRFVVIPEVMTDPSLIVALRSSTSGDPGEPGTALVREIQVAPGAPVTVVYRVFRARAEDYGIPGESLLTDLHGRPILLTEGLLIRDAASSVMASGVPQAALNQAHDLVTPAFRQFWAQGGGFTRQAGQPFTMPPADSPGAWLGLELAGPATQTPPPMPQMPALADPAAAPVPAAPPSQARGRKGGPRNAPRNRGRFWSIAAFVLGAIVLVALVLAGVVLLATHVLSAGPRVPMPSAPVTRSSTRRPPPEARIAVHDMPCLRDDRQSRSLRGCLLLPPPAGTGARSPSQSSCPQCSARWSG